jgi:hypothetical protein
MVLPSLCGEEARFAAYVEGLTSVIGMRIGPGRFAIIALA